MLALFTFATVNIVWHNDVINVLDSLILLIAFFGSWHYIFGYDDKRDKKRWGKLSTAMLALLFTFATVNIVWHKDVLNVVDSLILSIAFYWFLNITSLDMIKQGPKKQRRR